MAVKEDFKISSKVATVQSVHKNGILKKLREKRTSCVISNFETVLTGFLGHKCTTVCRYIINVCAHLLSGNSSFKCAVFVSFRIKRPLNAFQVLQLA